MSIISGFKYVTFFCKTNSFFPFQMYLGLSYPIDGGHNCIMDFVDKSRVQIDLYVRLVRYVPQCVLNIICGIQSLKIIKMRPAFL